MNVSFILNGEPVTAQADGLTLLRFLRGVRCLKGSKEGCGTGHCGACSVIIDGRLSRSCVIPMRSLEGRTVETIENAPNSPVMRTIQEAFAQAGAVQCGFCTPGMVMATKALLSQHPDPTDEQICEGLKNNYCRCTGYVKILEAVHLAAARLRSETVSAEDFRSHEKTVILQGTQDSGEKPAETPPSDNTSLLSDPAGFRQIHRPVPDVRGLQKAEGSLKFCDDLEAEDIGAEKMFHGAFVWAPVPHARIDNIDVSDALDCGGVVRVLTAKDVPGENKIGTWTPDQPVFCDKEVRFLGDFIALVIADTDAHARAAAGRVRVSYTELPGIYTFQDAVDVGEYLVTTGRNAGDVARAKDEDGLVKISVSKEIQPQEHACMEPVSAIGDYKGDVLTVYSCTQAPFEVRHMLSSILDMPEEQLRVVATPLGGGFGKKCDSFLEAAAAVAALAVRAAVKITLTRREDLILTTKRHGYHTDYEIGLGQDGRLRYIDSYMFSDGGPYMAESYGTLMTGCLMSGGPYIIDNIHVDARCVRTNNLQGGAFRGYGINQAAISIETAMDEAAEALKIDPFELRRRNCLHAGSYSVGGELLDSSVGMLDTINVCEKHLKEALKEYEGQYPKGNKVLGWGMASGFKNSGVGKGIFLDDGGCKLALSSDGHLDMIVSGTDMGQGFCTAMVQIAAEALHMETGDIDITVGDTASTIPTGESVAERQTLCSGRAVYEACMKLREDLREHPLADGEVRHAQAYFTAPECFPIGDFDSAEKKGVKYRNFPAYAYATQAAIVEVDKDTGVVKLLKVIAAHDVGRALNPMIIEGQLEGSCSMGQGYALTEGYPTVNGYPVKKLYRDLGLPRAEDTPDYDMILIEDPEPEGPYGAKGISEVATVPITPAILNAIYNAIGVRINKVPAAPDVILEAIQTGKCDAGKIIV